MEALLGYCCNLLSNKTLALSIFPSLTNTKAFNNVSSGASESILLALFNRFLALGISCFASSYCEHNSNPTNLLLAFDDMFRQALLRASVWFDSIWNIPQAIHWLAFQISSWNEFCALFINEDGKEGALSAINSFATKECTRPVKPDEMAFCKDCILSSLYSSLSLLPCCKSW